MKHIIKKAMTAAGILGLFSLAGTGFVTLAYHGTKAKIAENERAALLRNLRTIVPDGLYDNDIVNDTTVIRDMKSGGGHPVTVYRARMYGKPVAAVFTTVAPDGYNGNIKLLVAVKENGSLAGVRAVSHKETPGLGDGIEENRSDWILGFAGKSLGDPKEKAWAVKRDGGSFDQFTGATITPRAVVNAVKNTLLYYRANKGKIYAAKDERKSDKLREEA